MASVARNRSAFPRLSNTIGSGECQEPSFRQTSAVDRRWKTSMGHNHARLDAAPAPQHSRTLWPARMLPGCPSAADKIRVQYPLTRPSANSTVPCLGGKASNHASRPGDQASASSGLPPEHPAHDVKGPQQGKVTSARPGAHRLKLADECGVLGQLAAQVTPPCPVGASPAENRFDVAVVDGNQARALARQQLAGCDFAEPVPVLRPWLYVVQQLPQLPGRGRLQ
jgi:hypothetical protein